MKCIGIDLGHYSIKVFEVDATSKGIQLLNYTEHPLNLDPTFDNQILVIDVLRGLASANDPATTKFIACVPQAQISTRYKFFPFRERSKVLKSIPFELEDDIPFDQDDAIFEAKFVRYRGSTSEVLASACPRNHIQSVLTLFQDAGIDPDIVSAEGFALANLVEDFNSPPPQEELPRVTDDEEASEAESEEDQIKDHGYLMLNIGHRKTLLSAFRGFNLVSVRSLEWGAHEIAQTIAQKYQISFDEALREMESKAFVLTSPEGASRDQITFSNVIAGALNELIRELKLSIIDIQAQFQLDLTHLSMTGGASQIKNLGPFLTHALDVPSHRLEYMERFTDVFVEQTPQMMSHASVALGLAIEGAKRPLNPPTNFRQEELAKKSLALQFFWLRWGYAVKLAAAAFVAFFIYAVVQDFLTSHLDDSTRSALRRQAKVVGVERSTPSSIRRFLREKKNDLRHRSTLLKLSKMNSALDVLTQISQAAPAKGSAQLDIQELKVDVDQVTLKGKVRNTTELSLLENNLKSVAKNGLVKRLPATRSSSGVPFHFQLSVDRKVSLSQKPKKPRASKKKGE